MLINKGEDSWCVFESESEIRESVWLRECVEWYVCFNVNFYSINKMKIDLSYQYR